MVNALATEACGLSRRDSPPERPARVVKSWLNAVVKSWLSARLVVKDSLRKLLDE